MLGAHMLLQQTTHSHLTTLRRNNTQHIKQFIRLQDPHGLVLQASFLKKGCDDSVCVKACLCVV
jgi:hypothetical protein